MSCSSLRQPSPTLSAQTPPPPFKHSLLRGLGGTLPTPRPAAEGGVAPPPPPGMAAKLRPNRHCPPHCPPTGLQPPARLLHLLSSRQ